MPSESKFSIVCKSDDVEVTLYDAIDPWFGVSAKDFIDGLKEHKNAKRIRLRINSPGGSIFDGTAIYNYLRGHPAKKVVTVDGIAASMASVVAMAGDEIEVGDGAYMMIHDPIGWIRGDSGDMREYADLLDKMKSQIVGIYAKRTGLTEDEIASLMEDETWMTASEAVEKHFADRTIQGLKAAAHVDAGKFLRTPMNLLHKEQHMSQETKPATNGPATFKELKAACVGADEKFLCSQLEAEATVVQAQAAWMAEQNKRLEAANKAVDDAKAAASKAGVEPIETGKKKSDDDGDPIAAWDKILSDYQAKGHAYGKALSLAARNHKDAHKAYLEAYNVQHADKRREVK